MSSTMIRKILWERRHLVFFIDDMSKFQSSLDGVDVLFARAERATADAVVAAAQSANPRLQVIVLLREGISPTSTIAPDGTTYISSPIIAAEIVSALERAERNVQEYRKKEATASHMKQLLTQTRSCPWERGKLLGRGANAVVYEATNIVTSGKMAVRVIRIDRSNPERFKAVMDSLVNEIELMSELEHKNIIQYLYLERDGDSLNVFMEYAPGGSLRDHLDKNGAVAADRASVWLRDILEGLNYLHSKDVVHLDLKCANVLISARGECKLADFGTARRLKDVSRAQSDDADGTLGTIHFMAPEVLNNQRFDWRADVWSLGCLVIELLSGVLPFSNICDGALSLVGYISGLQQSDEIHIHPKIVDNDARDFIRSCLQVDPLRRPNAQTLLQHPFLCRARTTQTPTDPRVKVHVSRNALMDSDTDEDRRDSCFGNWTDHSRQNSKST
jgi:serine/threonine protein kinase